MTVEEFRETLSSATPPAVSTLVLALWHDAKGDWEKAHTLAQDVDDVHGAWVHAYLHRKEGDLGNAGYWYRRANQPIAKDWPVASFRNLLESRASVKKQLLSICAVSGQSSRNADNVSCTTSMCRAANSN